MALGMGEHRFCIHVCDVKGRNVTLRFGTVSGNEAELEKKAGVGLKPVRMVEIFMA